MQLNTSEFLMHPERLRPHLRLNSPFRTCERWIFPISKTAGACKHPNYWSIVQRSPGTSDFNSELPRGSSESTRRDPVEAFSICRGCRSSRRYHPLKKTCQRAMASAAVFAEAGWSWLMKVARVCLVSLSCSSFVSLRDILLRLDCTGKTALHTAAARSCASDPPES